MGIRSDVVVALKKNLVDDLTEEQKTAWFGAADRKLEHEEGTLYHWDHTKWYFEEYDHLVSLYEWLYNQDYDDFLVVVACHDYPESFDGDLGAWTDNPWNAHRMISISINIENPS